MKSLLDSRAGWITASAALAIMTIAYGAPLVRDCFSIQEANWRIPTVMFAGLLGITSGGWGAGLLYDRWRLPARLLDGHGLTPG